MLTGVAICLFFVMVLVLNQIHGILTSRQQTLNRRLKNTLTSEIGLFGEGKRQKHRMGTRNWLPRVSLPAFIEKQGYMDKLQTNLVKAGLPLKPEEMVIFCLILSLVGFMAGYLFFKSLIAGLGGIGVGTGIPYLWIQVLKRRRVVLLEDQLLDTVVLLANSLRAGHSFLQALELVSRETPPPLSNEFGRVIKETRVGIPVEEALLNIIKRVESKDLEMVVTGVLIQRQVGGNLAEVLDSIASTIDKRIKTRAKIKALTAQGRLSAWIVSLLPVAIGAFIFIKNPQFGRLMLVEPLGKMMLGVAVVAMVIGVLWIKGVVNIDA